MKELNLIHLILKKQGRSQKWLSKEIGVTTVSVNLWCKNKSQPSLEKLYQLSQILGVSPSELLNGNNLVNKPKNDN